MNSTPIRLSYIRWFQEIGIEDVPLVGGKNASLGELYQELVPKGIHVPNGFAITADAYWDLLGRTRLDQRIKEILSGLDTQDAANLQQRGNAVRRQLVGAALPDDLQAEIIAAYHQLCEGAAEPVDVAVRSSATAEDLPDASFAGQQETYLNVQGEAALLGKLQALLCLSVYRPGYFLPAGQRIRSFEGRSLDRHPAHGAL